MTVRFLGAVDLIGVGFRFFGVFSSGHCPTDDDFCPKTINLRRAMVVLLGHMSTLVLVLERLTGEWGANMRELYADAV